MKMASYMQGGGYTAASLRSQDHNNVGLKYPNRGRRQARGSARAFHPGCGYGVFVLLVLSIVSFTVIGGNYLFTFLRTHKGAQILPETHDIFENQDQTGLFSLWSSQRNPTDRSFKMSPKWKENIDNVIIEKKESSLQFGKPYDQKEEFLDRDSRYWDRDDRKRIRYADYDVDDDVDDDNDDEWIEDKYEKDNQGHLLEIQQKENTGLSKSSGEGLTSKDVERDPAIKQENPWKPSNRQSGGLYNERGRKELHEYEQKLEADLEQELHNSNGKDVLRSNNEDLTVSQDGMQRLGNAEYTSVKQKQKNETGESSKENPALEEEYLYGNYDEPSHDLEQEDPQSNFGAAHNLENGTGLQNDNVMFDVGNNKRRQTSMQQHVGRKSRHHQRNTCHIDFLNTTAGLKEPQPNLKFQNFSLNYVQFEDPPPAVAGWEPRFAGHPTLSQRNQYFVATDQTIHCGFVRTSGISQSSGFDLAEADVQYMSTCKIAVTSCIFGSSDNIRSPRNRKLTGSFKKDVCFVMFVDQQTLDVMKQEGQDLDNKGYLDSWKVVVVKNMPYLDARRVGKIPKFLAHRLFPAARFSIWLDSKLRLQIDPVLILEYFLWRGGYEYAISNHYDRHCVWEEVLQNKKLNKYNHTAIDEQFAFYRADGLTRFNASDPKKLLPSNVPEGSFIIREHSSMSNLFSCLWFNEVDRFTSRDQLSFAYTYMKLIRMNPGKRFYLNMFKDCERRSIAKLFRHRSGGSNMLDVQK